MGRMGTVLGAERKVCQVPQVVLSLHKARVLQTCTWVSAPVGACRPPGPTLGSRYKLRGSVGSLLVGYLVLMLQTNFK